MKKFLILFIIHSSLFITLYASTLNLSIGSNPSRLNPILANDSASSEISGWIFNGLFKYDKNGKLTTDLAQSYEFLNPTHLIIRLKKGVLWHDKHPFSAKDVVFTYETIISPTIFTSIASNYQKVQSVKALDDYTIEVIYKEPYFKALEIWMVGILPKHLLQDEKDLMKSSFNKQPIGTGPYELKELKTSSDIQLQVNEDYFEGKPHIETINYKFLPDTTTAFLMLKQKSLDVGALTPLQIKRQINERFKQNYQIIQRPSFAYTYLGFNLKEKKFKDPKVRKALSLAIDRQELVDILFFGYAQACTGPFLPGSFAFNDKIKLPKPDIQKAKALLKDAGYDEANPFRFSVVTNTGNETRINAALILQYQLQKIGVEMSIKVMEWQAFLNTVVHPRNFEAVILGWSLSLMPDAYPIWHSSSQAKGGFNFVGYENQEVDVLIEKASKTIDEKELARLYQNIFKKITQDNPYLFLYIPHSITVVNRAIQNVEPSLIGIMHNQKDWIKPEGLK
jgi:peptide/nickel transport system substrate-binding protein